MSNLSELCKNAIDELRERLQSEFTDEPHGIIFEIVDSHVPVYTSDLLHLATENLLLATNEPELGPAFDGSPTPMNIIAANVFEYLEGELWEAFEEIKDELKLEAEEEE